MALVSSLLLRCGLLLPVFSDQCFGAGDGAGLGLTKGEFAVLVEVVEVDDGIDRFRRLVNDTDVIEACDDLGACQITVAVGVDEVELLLQADHLPSDDIWISRGWRRAARGDEDENGKCDECFHFREWWF